ncbi:DUF6154 family protein [Bacillus badius]|uniref:Uncharacterized protein n=1 Tax=Bacillus badius TaxID=1455 RepID=A0ABR5ASW9_BACBA|nr:DUF6154 family protein [Bacillus badius]KIL75721.1 hypothetical protein SD78_2790 [Bacillus badius]KIL77855.1 hypothetical protein SD77_1184 [Bacillus badius]KZO01374.1 hypothetical protein A4244_11480 [Bacillus badius]KZR59175.1 hypothetical protein A3781_13495 [Bacillus badius]MED0665230.1 DUF6154 family protein [Bacillus badius]
MKLVDELFEMYRGKLQGTEEDLDMITLAVLEQLSQKEILSIIKELNEDELTYFFRLYLFEALKQKFDMDSMGDNFDDNRLYH